MLWLASCAFPRPADVSDDGNGNDDLCGNGVTDSNVGEQCESEGNDSQACNGKTAGAVACHVPACGDGYINSLFNPDGAHAEECDNLGGGNTQACNGNNGGANSAGSCRQPRCGDGYTNEQFKPDGLHPEECDVGTSDTSVCNGSNAPSAVQCQRAECGDGYINAQFKPDGAHAEQCDNLGGRNTPACNGNNGGNNGPGSCLQPFCGDGYTNDQFKPDGIHPEQCDSGTAGDTSACNSSTAPAALRCQPAVCGDSYRNLAAEGCDRGPSDTSTCNGNTAGPASCKESICGDGHINRLAGEQCEMDTDCPANQKCNSVCQCN